jgi:hypothetical protein
MVMVMLVLQGLLAQAGRFPQGGHGGGDEAADAVANLFVLVIELLIAIPTIVGMWGVFAKAGQPGWAAIVPFYNIYVLLKITDKPEWWLIPWVCCPVVNLIVVILVNIELATRFGKSGAFAVGLIFLPFIFFPILGFGDARYQKPGFRDDYGYDDEEEGPPPDRLPPDDRIQGDRGGYR